MKSSNNMGTSVIYSAKTIIKIPLKDLLPVKMANSLRIILISPQSRNMTQPPSMCTTANKTRKDPNLNGRRKIDGLVFQKLNST